MNMLGRLFKEVKRRTKVVRVFPNETSASTLAAGDYAEEQRGVGAEALPDDERPQSSRKSESTTFETLT